MTQQQQHRVVIGLSASTAAFVAVLASLGLIALMLVGLCHCEISGGDAVTRPARTPAVPRIGPPALAPPVGSAVDPVKESELDRQYGRVNKAALEEVKEGLFARLRCRAASRCSTAWSRPVSYQRPQYVRHSPQYVVPPYAMPVPTWTEPRPAYEPYPEIDSSTCRDGSCELHAGAEAAPPCPGGQCPLRGDLAVSSLEAFILTGK